MFENQDEKTISTLASILKCVCSSPEQMNTCAILLASTIARNSSKDEVFKLTHFFTLISSALRSYI